MALARRAICFAVAVVFVLVCNVVWLTSRRATTRKSAYREALAAAIGPLLTSARSSRSPIASASSYRLLDDVEGAYQGDCSDGVAGLVDSPPLRRGQVAKTGHPPLEYW